MIAVGGAWWSPTQPSQPADADQPRRPVRSVSETCRRSEPRAGGRAAGLGEVVVAQRDGPYAGAARGSADQGDVEVAVRQGPGTGFGVDLDEAEHYVRAQGAVVA